MCKVGKWQFGVSVLRPAPFLWSHTWGIGLLHGWSEQKTPQAPPWCNAVEFYSLKLSCWHHLTVRTWRFYRLSSPHLQYRRLRNSVLKTKASRGCAVLTTCRSEHLRTPGVQHLRAFFLTWVCVCVCVWALVVVVTRTLRWFRHGRAQTVHVVASVAVITKQQLVLEQKRIFR